MATATIPGHRANQEVISKGASNQKPSKGALRQTERNPGGLSLTPAGLHKSGLMT